MTNEERTDHLFTVLDRAVTELHGKGFDPGPAPYRAMITYILDRLPHTLCRDHLREDLTRIAGMIEHEIRELDPQAH